MALTPAVSSHASEVVHLLSEQLQRLPVPPGQSRVVGDITAKAAVVAHVTFEQVQTSKDTVITTPTGEQVIRPLEECQAKLTITYDHKIAEKAILPPPKPPKEHKHHKHHEHKSHEHKHHDHKSHGHKHHDHKSHRHKDKHHSDSSDSSDSSGDEK